MGCVPLIEPPGKSNVAGDFHRPYENSEIFYRPKIPRFAPGEGYRVGQGTHVWVPAQSVTKNYQESILVKISM